MASNLGELIQAIRKIRNEKIAVITNASLMDQDDVHRDLALADYVLAKLDACSQEMLLEIDHPENNLHFTKIVQGIINFRKYFSGKLALQIMFMKENKNYADDIARIAREIQPDEVQINTPLRKSAVQPLSEEELSNIKRYFYDLPVVSVYEKERRNETPMDQKATVKRHGR